MQKSPKPNDILSPYKIFTDISSPDPEERKMQVSNAVFEVDLKTSNNNCSIQMIEMKHELEKLMDLKIAQNNLKYSNEGNEILVKNFGDRVSLLEHQSLQIREDVIQKYKENNDLIKDVRSSMKIENFESQVSPRLKIRLESFLEEKDQIKIFKEDLDNDSYLYLSVALSFTALPLVLGYLYVIFFKQNIPFIKRVKWLISVMFSPLLLVPGIASAVVQAYCASYVYEEAQSQFSLFDKLNYQVLKILILLIFIFMVAREATQAINNFFFCFFEAKSKYQFFFAGCFLPPIVQTTISFFILFVSFLLIASTDDPISLIQNFASVYILLEVDNIMMDFLRLSKLSIIFVLINEKLQKLRLEIGLIEIFSKDLTKKILVEKTLEINYENRGRNFKAAFLLIRVILVASLAAFSIFVWVYYILEKTTQD